MTGPKGPSVTVSPGLTPVQSSVTQIVSTCEDRQRPVTTSPRPDQ